MIEPIFEAEDFRLVRGKVARYTHVSQGSGRDIYIHFCATCGTKLYLRFVRWPHRLGVYMGTLDNPDWFDRSPESVKYVFLDAAQQGTLIPECVKTYRQHSITNDGEPIEPEVSQQVKRM